MKAKRDMTETRLACINARLNEIQSSTSPNFIKESEIEELIELCNQDGFKDKADEIANDRRFVYGESESNTDPNEDRENDVEWNNRPNQIYKG